MKYKIDKEVASITGITRCETDGLSDFVTINIHGVEYTYIMPLNILDSEEESKDD